MIVRNCPGNIWIRYLVWRENPKFLYDVICFPFPDVREIRSLVSFAIWCKPGLIFREILSKFVLEKKQCLHGRQLFILDKNETSLCKRKTWCFHGVASSTVSFKRWVKMVRDVANLELNLCLSRRKMVTIRKKNLCLRSCLLNVTSS